MPGIDRWNISPETRAKFEAILDEAPALGIDRNQAVAAGLPGLRALIGLKKASEALTRKTRTAALTETRDALRGVARRNPKLASQFEARIMAMQGRGSDTEIAHVARGELVVPQALQDPEVVAALRRAAAAYGVPVEMLLVGNARNSINPQTGAAEFGVLDWLKDKMGIRENSAAPAAANTYNPSDVNAPATQAPSYDQLNFDPKGSGQWGTVLRHPLAAYQAYKDSQAAQEDARAKYGATDRGLHNGETDAYRHAQWNRRMTQSIGSELAKAFSDAHERSSVNPDSERLMDLYNNQIGRSGLTPDEVLKRLRKSPFEK